MPAALQLAVVVTIAAAAVQEKLIDAPVLDFLTVWETLRQSNPVELHPTSCQKTREKIHYMEEMSVCVRLHYLYSHWRHVRRFIQQIRIFLNMRS